MGEDYSVRYKRQYDRRVFQSITTEEQAYWLGFILADGYINEERYTLRIKLAEKDLNHLKKFAIFMKDENPQIKSDIGGAYSKDNICYFIEYNSKELIEDLKQYNLHQGKSGKEKPITLPTEELTLAYIRGMIDGDGHVEPGYFKYVGSLTSCEFMKNIFSKWFSFNPEAKYIYPHGTIYSFELRNLEVNKIFKLIYNEPKIYLDRKYQTVQKI